MSLKKIKKILEEFGLSEKETEVYVFLAKYGTLRAGKIAEKTRIDRSVVYRLLRRLQKKGLVEPTLESPARFVARPFEKALDAIIKKKENEALQIRKSRSVLLEDWQSISEPASELELEKFIVIEGTKNIYQKITQMVNETKSQFHVILPISDLARAEQFGVFDATYNHPFKSNIQFKLVTELNHDNLKAIKLLKPKLQREIQLRARQASIDSLALPRIVMKDEKEILIFTRPGTDSFGKRQTSACIHTNCLSLVQTYRGIFNDLWNASEEIEKNITAIESGKYPKIEPDKIDGFARKAVEVEEKARSSASQELDQENNIAARLASDFKLLKEEEKDIIECASVIGDEFSVQTLERVLGFSRLRLLKTLIKTEKQALIKAAGEDYQFSNHEIRELVYDQIAPKLQREYHSLVAQQLESEYEDGSLEVMEKLAHHYFLSGDVEKGAPILVEVAENVWNQKFDLSERQNAIKYYSNAIELMGTNDEYKEYKTEALEKLGDIYSTLIQHDRAKEFYEEARVTTTNSELKDRIVRKIREKRLVEKDGVELAYSVYGKGDQTILFVGNSAHFMPQVLHFSRKYRVAVMDLTEMLVPEKMPTEYSMRFYLENMKAVVEHLKTEKIHLSGVALGGTLAIYFAVRYPEKIIKLCLVAAQLKGYSVEHPERRKQTDRFWAEAFQSPYWGWKMFKKETLKTYEFQDFVKKKRKLKDFLRSFIQISDQAIPSEVLLINYKILSEADVRPLLGKIKTPTLILHGEKDFLPLADVEFLNRNIRGSKLSVFKDGSFVTLTETKKTNKVLEEFFSI